MGRIVFRFGPFLISNALRLRTYWEFIAVHALGDLRSHAHGIGINHDVEHNAFSDSFDFGF